MYRICITKIVTLFLFVSCKDASIKQAGSEVVSIDSLSFPRSYNTTAKELFQVASNDWTCGFYSDNRTF